MEYGRGNGAGLSLILKVGGKTEQVAGDFSFLLVSGFSFYVRVPWVPNYKSRKKFPTYLTFSWMVIVNRANLTPPMCFKMSYHCVSKFIALLTKCLVIMLKLWWEKWCRISTKMCLRYETTLTPTSSSKGTLFLPIFARTYICSKTWQLKIRDSRKNSVKWTKVYLISRFSLQNWLRGPSPGWGFWHLRVFPWSGI